MDRFTGGGNTSTVTGLIAGVYTVTISDAIVSNCTITTATTVTEPVLSCSLSITAVSTDLTANGTSSGTATATVAGSQSTVTYLWSNQSVTASISGLNAGIYTVTATDDIIGGCSATTAVTVNEPSLVCTVSVTINATDVSTTGGSDGAATVVVVGGQSTLTYVWSGGQNTSTITGLNAGSYEVTVSDAVVANCSATATIIINEPTGIDTSLTLILNLEGNTDATGFNIIEDILAPTTSGDTITFLQEMII